MGTDLVYKQTQVQVKSKIYTSTDIEGYFNMNSFDNITLVFNLPLERYDIFSFEYVIIYSKRSIAADLLTFYVNKYFKYEYFFQIRILL